MLHKRVIPQSSNPYDEYGSGQGFSGTWWDPFHFSGSGGSGGSGTGTEGISEHKVRPI